MNISANNSVYNNIKANNSYIGNQEIKTDDSPAQNINSKNYDNPMLDKRANDILNKVISKENLTSEESNLVKARLRVMMTEVVLDSDGKITDAPVKAPEMSASAVNERIDNLLHNLELNLNSGAFEDENKLLYSVATQLKTLYTSQYTPLDTKA